MFLARILSLRVSVRGSKYERRPRLSCRDLRSCPIMFHYQPLSVPTSQTDVDARFLTSLEDNGDECNNVDKMLFHCCFIFMLLCFFVIVLMCCFVLLSLATPLHRSEEGSGVGASLFFAAKIPPFFSSYRIINEKNCTIREIHPMDAFFHRLYSSKHDSVRYYTDTMSYFSSYCGMMKHSRMYNRMPGKATENVVRIAYPARTSVGSISK